MVIGHISPHSRKEVCLCRSTRVFIRPRPLNQEEGSTERPITPISLWLNVFTTVKTPSTRNWLSVGRRSLFSSALVQCWKTVKKRKKSQPSSRSWRLWRGFDASFAYLMGTTLSRVAVIQWFKHPNERNSLGLISFKLLISLSS